MKLKTITALLFLGICGAANAQVTVNTPAIGLNPVNDRFTYDGKGVAHYGLGWYHDSWFNYGPTAFLSGYGGIKFFTLGKVVMSLNQYGQLGIGTQSTQGYMLAVKGKIRSQEVKVETANWPDYVFEEGYQLPDLNELSEYINTHKRLPGMPSAKEAEANGIALGEMNRLLLEKVEELTLLLIDRDKGMAAVLHRLEYLERKDSGVPAINNNIK